MELRIAHLYPDLLNLYGDRGNIIALQRRCTWRSIGCSVTDVSIGDVFDASRYDLVFMGGGQDDEQNLLHQDLIENKGPLIRQAVEDGLVFLCICGSYQLMGRYYEEQDGSRISGIGALDLWTQAKPKRLIGDLVARSDFLARQGRDPLLVGFENHSGRTWLGSSVQPLAIVERGFGNNGEDHGEGAIYKNTYCTYAHGSFLPKNPDMADHLIETALKRRFSDMEPLLKLDNLYENNARSFLLSCK
ncbi:MAG: glutamine amidotransferase [Eubacteriales bacterium]|nr:glutamine amidotransferase [Eubacteriales bacterium]